MLELLLELLWSKTLSVPFLASIENNQLADGSPYTTPSIIENFGKNISF